MKLLMTGIDYKRSNLAAREKFAVTKSGAGEIVKFFIERGAKGCVIISTCNRTEVYVSIPNDNDMPTAQILCDALGKKFSDHSSHFTQSEDENVIKHLCRVACGLDSQILGDDQIITQTREALELSRGYGCTNNHIETAFNISISAAKIIKTKVLAKLKSISSVPQATIEKIKNMCLLADKNALVIGNGKIGRRVAELLVKEGVSVTVTLRSRKKNTIQIPDGVCTISYDERYAAIEKSDIVISATASPHLTICMDKVISLNHALKIIIDLAVPRDVESSIANMQGVTLLTIDDILGAEKIMPRESVFAIEAIIGEHIEKYRRWLSFKESGHKNFFPMFIDMSGRKVLIVGGGNVAGRRAETLANFGADVTVISPKISEYIERAAQSNIIHLIKRKYCKGDVADIKPFLVIAATNDRETNREVTEEAEALGVFISVADRRDECSFYFPAIAQNDNYVAGIVSKNGDHAGVKEKVRKIREIINT